jgi:class 3 adenylate cyclase
VPAQTRGFLFSDLRGYSAFVERHGDRAARELLTRYRRVVRDVIGRFGGAEVRTEGDSFYVVFDSVSQAVEAGLAIQAALAADTEGEPIRAGIGIHAGEVEDDAEQGIVSGAVNIAARICALADPGEVLVSDIVRGLTRGYLDISFVPRGRRKLKGIRDPVAVYGVRATAGSGPRRIRLPVAAAAIAVVGVAIAGALTAVGVLRGGLPGGTVGASVEAHSTVSPAETQTRPPASEAGTSPSGGTGFFAGPYPNRYEEDLLARLPDDLAAMCLRADEDEIPEKPPRAYQRTPFPAIAGVRCRINDYLNVFFFAGAGASAPEETVHYYAGRRGVQDRSCTETEAGFERWSFGPASGWVLCSEDAFWTYDDTAILGRAIGRDLRSTMAWWRDNARFPAD